MSGDALFWIAFGALAYLYLGYPLLLAFVALFLSRACQEDEQTPAVSLVVAAHNESAVIADKIRNTLALDYRADRIQLIVVSDASDDGTDDIVRSCSDTRVVLVRQEQQGGKSAALNRGVAEASGEILVFSDANSMFVPGAVRALVRRFADPRIGAVSGVLHYEADRAATGEGLYWRYEQIVKGLESRTGRLLGANGAIFAIRREFMPRLHPLDVTDFRIPYQALIEGRSVVLAPEAAAREQAAATLGGEMARKVRIMSRALPMFFSLVPPTIRAGRPLVAWQLVSHKLLREIQAVFFLSMLVGAAWSWAAGSGLGPWLLGVQAAGYGIGAAGWASRTLRRLLPVRVATYVTMIAVTSVWAVARWVSGRNRATWMRTARTG
jgi:hypothetical protein